MTSALLYDTVREVEADIAAVLKQQQQQQQRQQGEVARGMDPDGGQQVQLWRVESEREALWRRLMQQEGDCTDLRGQLMEQARECMRLQRRTAWQERELARLAAQAGAHSAQSVTSESHDTQSKSMETDGYGQLRHGTIA